MLKWSPGSRRCNASRRLARAWRIEAPSIDPDVSITIMISLGDTGGAFSAEGGNSIIMP